MVNVNKLIADINNISDICASSNTIKTGDACEKIVCDILAENNIKNAEEFKTIAKEYIKNNTEHEIPLSDGIYYIHHLYGTQQFPDIVLLLIKNKKIIMFHYLEIKSGKGKIMWNDGIPLENCSYIYIDTVCKKTFILSYEDLMPDKSVNNILIEIREEISKLNLKYRNILKDSMYYTTTRGALQQKINIDILNIEILNNNFAIIFNNIFGLSQSYDEINGATENNNIGEIKEHIQLPVLVRDGLKAISLFSGAGGDTKGLHDAGIEVVGFVENDADAINTHLLNFPECKLIGNDICDITEIDLAPYINKIDFIFGGFPCQSFSHGGKKSPDDPRGQLYKQFIRITNIIRPKFILGENVKGILSRKDASGNLFVDSLIKEFKDIGYTIIYKLISCENFHVPQVRKRVIFVGINDEMKINPDDITIPERSLNDVTKNIRDICEISLHDALKIDKKKFIDLVPENKLIHITGSSLTVSGSPPTNLIKCYNEVKSERNSDFDISFAKRKGGNFSCVVDLDGPSCTILCTYNRMPRLFIPLIQNGIIYFRPFTTNELKQIQGFPMSYNFAGNNMSIIKQIGNAVPPVVVTEIINYLKQFIL